MPPLRLRPMVGYINLEVVSLMYAFELPQATDRFSIRCRTANDLFLADGESGYATGNYITISSGQTHHERDLWLSGPLTLWVAALTGGLVVEVLYWVKVGH